MPQWPDVCVDRRSDGESDDDESEQPASGVHTSEPLVRLAKPSMLQGTATDTKKRKNFAEIAQATFGDKARLMVCPRSDSCG